ncbi:NADP-dependent 3-hydroxy acid dehydrogenase YdfG [Xanthomonas arboricola]|uniref:Short-chain dehydrogenase n=1 Tax=Xanthomonas cannabis pv. phaseoli TaxID=1885902 RepID=A0AB34P9K5_9XANT|nr:SDR family oxidoreductase [Xanthomonas cannabis]KGK58036.1 short-chain dehydrogenase [Xanthomonas cannabis pv. phaseoli]MBB3803757.1 NADP-dependent 3-hydroxy acid dehydrogenase YdfG [Xanthomonas cannabis]
MAAHRPLDQQVILITGASSGIGLCTALAAAEAGARVVLVARSSGILQEVAALLTEQGHQAIAVVADVADPAQLQHAADAALARFGRIDTWVNNAGVAIFGLLQEVDDHDSRRMFDINFWGVVYGSRIALPHLAASGGVLINLGSEASEAVVPWQGLYSASKHAVKGFTDSLRIELEHLAGSPVSVVLIQPTAVDTPYPQHARNYMPQEPQLPPPLIEPLRVADAILHAAEHGGRDIKVGLMAGANIAITRLMPRLADRLSAMRAQTQQGGAPARDPKGTLFHPGEGGRVHGEHTAG